MDDAPHLLTLVGRGMSLLASSIHSKPSQPFPHCNPKDCYRARELRRRAKALHEALTNINEEEEDYRQGPPRGGMGPSSFDPLAVLAAAAGALAGQDCECVLLREEALRQYPELFRIYMRAALVFPTLLASAVEGRHALGRAAQRLTQLWTEFEAAGQHVVFLDGEYRVLYSFVEDILRELQFVAIDLDISLDTSCTQ